MSGAAFGQPMSEDDRPRFAGLRTFMQLPAASDATGYRLAVIGAPFDTGTTYRTGQRFGPAAMRDASMMLFPYHPFHAVDVFRALPGVDVGDVAVVPGAAEESLQRIEADVAAILAAGAAPFVLGGDHTVALAELRAHVKHLGRPVCLVHLDSHSDLWDEFWGTRFNHGTPFRRALEEGLIDVGGSVQVGLRGGLTSPEDQTQGRDFGLDVVTCDEWLDAGTAQTAAAIRQRVGNRPVVISFDVDVVDPAFAPGTGTPEVGGPTSRETLRLLRLLAGLHVVGADVVEVAPAYDYGQITALLGATVILEQMALHVVAKQPNTSQ